MTVPEIIIFEASKDYQENPEAVTAAAVVQLKGIEGIEASYHGFQYDDELEAGVKKAVWVNVWDSYDSASKQLAHLQSLFKPENKPEIYHVKSGSDLIKPISATCTEIARMNLHTGESTAALAELVDQLEASLKGGEGAHDSTWGPTFEDPNVTIGILGWDSKEAHLKAVAPGTKAYDIIQKILKIADITLLHTDLKKFSA
ncbi:hypothetical protein HWV62_2974 [Athelia sp. TMB]|nr:hypothetical protein HWV62_2974 [Athelia sp. TMB]